MPRKLPWLQSLSTQPKVTTSRVTKKPTIARPKRSDIGSDADSDDQPMVIPRERANGTGREPSSSPPLASNAVPPAIEFMKEGLEFDDCWIMVEDEFMSTAKHFTRHLHQAEYDRLKQLAKTRNASAINSITSPKRHQKLSTEVRIRHRSEALAGKQKALLGPLASDEESDEDPWANNPHLAGLVSQARHPSSKLSRVAGITSNTRASRGYAQPEVQGNASCVKQEHSVSADEDHSDRIQASRQRLRAAPSKSQVPASKLGTSAIPEVHSLSDSGSKNPHRRLPPTSDLDDGVTSKPSSTAAPRDFAERMARRRLDLAKRKKREDQTISMDQVPTFLL